MKKVILFLSIIGTTLLMTSCLDGETAYSGVPLSYISTTETGLVYAFTLDGLPITSPEIKREIPGSLVYIAYSWKESENTVTPEGIYDATVTEISDPIEQANIILSDAPELETELPITFFNSVFYGGPNFGYNWVCGYGYEKGEGNKKVLRFYHNTDESESENEIIIDVRLVDAMGSIDKDQKDILSAVNIKGLQDYYASSISSSNQYKDFSVYFRYYNKKSDGTLELTKTQQPSTMRIFKEQ